MKERLRFRWKQKKATRKVIREGAKTGPVSIGPKRMLRLKMRNLRYVQMHPERVMVKVEEEKGDFFPPHIMAIADPVVREQMMKEYMALRAMLQCQRRYKKRNCQSEMSILKQSKLVGLFPKSYVRRDAETKAWEKRVKFEKMELARKKQARKASRNKRVIRKTYADLLLGGYVKSGLITLKKRRSKKKHSVGTRVVRNGRLVRVAV